MKYVDHVDNELEQGCRSIDFIYREWLGEIAGICKVMDYKMICCSRYASEMNRVNWKPVKEIIKKEIAHNPYLVQKFLNKWTIFLFCSILFSSNQKEH